MRKFLSGASALAFAVTGVMASAPAAQAAASVPAPYKLVSSCSGSMVSGFPKVLKNQLGDTQGSLRLYYSSANGGTNCAILYDVAPGAHAMTVTLKRADLSYQGSDSGTFETYAGGVAVTGAARQCVYTSGTLSMGSHSVDRFSVSSGAVGCP
jgi:hypothetical protein